MVTVGAALLIITQPDVVSPSQVGLVVTYSLNITQVGLKSKCKVYTKKKHKIEPIQVLNGLVRLTAEVETDIVAVERLKEYSMIEQEAPWIWPDNRPEEAWPQAGMMEFEDYGMRYREDTPLVVQNISVKVDGGQKVGIVGRTGAGKSTLTVALFRLVEAALGKIKIDGKDISYC